MGMKRFDKKLTLVALGLSILFLAGRLLADDTIKGQVLGGGEPIAKSTVTLWEASAGAPKQLAQTKTDGDGRFEVRSQGAGADTILYLIAAGGEAKAKSGSGDNPVIALLSVLGNHPPDKAVINELTTVASAFTASRFINGDSISGNPLGLRIAAGNAPNLVDPTIGGWGKVLVDPVNSTYTTALANLNTEMFPNSLPKSWRGLRARYVRI